MRDILCLGYRNADPMAASPPDKGRSIDAKAPVRRYRAMKSAKGGHGNGGEARRRGDTGF
jgi:hypothetical protein